jgi:Cu+-exporting ATPase
VDSVAVDSAAVAGHAAAGHSVYSVDSVAVDSVAVAGHAAARHSVYSVDSVAVDSVAVAVAEVAGRGVRGVVGGETVAIGSSAFIESITGAIPFGPEGATFVVAGRSHGWVRVTSAPRPGVEDAARSLSEAHDVYLLSGDHHGEQSRWERLFGSRMWFRQSPDDKLSFVRGARRDGRRVLMVGDGLNDAGALAAADVGMAVSDQTACMAPACDAVIDGRRLAELPVFLRFARRARQVVVVCFVVSIAYNAIGLSLALAGALTPLAAAILMPVSSLTIAGISSGAMRWSARRMLPR